MWLFHVRWASICTPRNLITYTRCIRVPYIFMSISLALLFVGWNIIWWVLRTFQQSVLQFSHSWMACTSLSIWLQRASISLPVLNILVSSANNIEKQWYETFAKSLIYNIKNNGPNMEPWGTPNVIFSLFGIWLLYVTYWVLFYIFLISSAIYCGPPYRKL